MTDRQRLSDAFERNKQRFEQDRKNASQRAFRTKIIALAAFVLTSAGGAVFTGALKPLGAWVSAQATLASCAVHDQFLQNSAPSSFTVVILPFQNDDPEDATRLALSRALLTGFAANVIQPCTKLQFPSSGDPDATRQGFRVALKRRLEKYDADLILFGSVRGGKPQLYGETVPSADNFDVESLPKTVDPDDTNIDIRNVGIAFENEMIEGARYRVTAFGCSYTLRVGCPADTSFQDAMAALTKAWMIRTRVVILVDAPLNEAGYQFMLLNAYAIALYLAEHTRTIHDTDGKLQSIYQVTTHLALEFSQRVSSRGSSNLVSVPNVFSKKWEPLLLGQINLKFGEECDDLEAMRLASFELNKALQVLDAFGPHLLETAQIDEIFATLLLARTKSDLLSREIGFNLPELTKEFVALRTKLAAVDPKELDRQLGVVQVPADMRNRFVKAFEDELRRLNAISTPTKAQTADMSPSAAAKTACGRGKPF